MAEFKKTVTTSNDQGVSETGAEVRQQTQKVSTSASGDSKLTTANFVWYIVGLIEVLLAFRFILKMLGANPSSGFVNLIYSITGILTLPFDSIFGVTTAKSGDVHSVLEPSILVAAAVYVLIGWGIVKLINLNTKD